MTTVDGPPLVHVEGGAQSDVDPLHAGGAGEGAHEPLVSALHVVVVHAREESDWVPHVELHHANWAPGERGKGMEVKAF